ncbi:alpha-E domain-containing protein [Paenarthrobacter sp. NPDC092416]|uniref:alpha-E domain-containing protein n=1 Tax=Paenarthrobacter sp. NPDC092416 TaxID=3364386 RepID=UPI0037FFB182
MLSRIAESLFWIGRYVERADGTARILDVHLERMNNLPATQQEQISRDLLALMGVPAGPGPVTRDNLLKTLAYDARSPGSIAGSLSAARENARRARETVSSSLWEGLNTTFYGIGKHHRDLVGAYGFCHWVLERSAMVTGLADSTVSHDESWLFLKLGRSLERADMTARMLSTRDLVSGGISWVHMLRCAGAYESFIRNRGGSSGDQNAAEFLLLDRLFPRSIVYALHDAEKCLMKLEPASQRVGFIDDARRIVGQARTFLEFHRTDNLLEELPEHMGRVQKAVFQASEAISYKYFNQTKQLEWIGEVS